MKRNTLRIMPIQPIPETQDRSTNIHIAVLYARADQEAWEELEKQFTSINARYPNVHIWTATDIDIGGSVDRQLKDELKRADITLLLFSPEFVNDDIVDEEVRDLLTTYARFSDSDAYRKEERFIMPILLNHLYGWDDIYDQYRLPCLPGSVSYPASCTMVASPVMKIRRFSRNTGERSTLSLMTTSISSARTSKPGRLI